MPTFPKFEIPTIDLTKFELPKFDLPTVDLPKFEMPTFELPKFEMPSNVQLPSVEQLTAFARDAAYVGVGLAVTTVERLQELQAQLVELVKSASATVVERVRDAV